MKKFMIVTVSLLMVLSVLIVPIKEANAEAKQRLVSMIAVDEAQFYSKPILKKEYVVGTMKYGTFFYSEDAIKGWEVKNLNGQKVYIPSSLIVRYTEIPFTRVNTLDVTLIRSAPDYKSKPRGGAITGDEMGAFGIVGDWLFVVYIWGTNANQSVSGFVPISTVRAAKMPVIQPVVPPILPTVGGAIESTISGDFEGYEDGNIYELDNGQIWRQVSFQHSYRYNYRPKVIIYKSGVNFKMHVEGMRDDITVERLK